MKDPDHPLFHRGAVVAFGRSLGLKDDLTIRWITDCGATVIPDDRPRNPLTKKPASRLQKYPKVRL